MATCHSFSVCVSMTDGERMWVCVNLSAQMGTVSPTKEDHPHVHRLRDVSPFYYLLLAIR